VSSSGGNKENRKEALVEDLLNSSWSWHFWGSQFST
jgi:hypothetical protein